MKYIGICILFVLLSCSKKNTSVQINNLVFDHIVIVILENHAYEQLVGDSTHAPYINSLINDSHTALFTNSYSIAHPSQPNYMILFSGDNQGIVNDSIAKDTPFHTPNLGSEIIKKGLSFSGYSESLPYDGFAGYNYFLYFRTINPWVNWQGSGENGIPWQDNKPFAEFSTDYSKLPTISFVIPNVLHDMHNGTISNCDQWIKDNLKPFIEWAKTHKSLFILTFDEDDDKHSNHILTLFTGDVIKGAIYNQKITHYNILRTIEDFYQLPYAAKSADSSSIKNIIQ